MDPVVKPRGDTVGFTGPRNNALRATARSVAISGSLTRLPRRFAPRNDFY
ncbi:hypothetical protein N7281_02170 [Rickettsia hoogstraalii]|nr:hypothetical protein [Rickettsia hoogstraalii]MCX4083693.1 hypothetical protein [Rickettsia hoogstraalii]